MMDQKIDLPTSLARLLGRAPHLVATIRILKNQYHGLRQALGIGIYKFDGVTHLHKDVSQSVAYILEVVNDYLRYAGLPENALQGRDVLEIGPGDSLGVALMLAGRGVRQVVCVDRFATHRDPGKERRILARLVELAPPAARERMKRCLDREGRIRGDVIRYLSDTPIERAAEKLGGMKFDYVVSRSVLEHVYDIDEAYASCRTLIRDGGLMIHKVDLSNQSIIERHPLQFLTHSHAAWRLMSSHIGRINRCRWPQHRDALDRNRFRIERFGATAILDLSQVRSIRPRLAPPFREMADEDLSIYGFFVVCRAV